MSFEEELKLIEAVREQPLLYDLQYKSYNPNMRIVIWKKIAMRVGRSVDICKQRWKSLRDRFVRECRRLNRQKLLLPDGSQMTGIRVWCHYENMQFLKTSIIPRKKKFTDYETDPIEFDPLTSYEIEQLEEMKPSDCISKHSGSPTAVSIAESAEYAAVSDTETEIKRRKLEDNEQVVELLGDMRQALLKISDHSEKQTSTYAKLLDEKLNELPMKERHLMEISILQQINDKILEIAESSKIQHEEV